MDNSSVFVKNDVYPIEELFLEKYDVDFYQREYVWEKKQIEDMVEDLTIEFLKNWKHRGEELSKVNEYSPYYILAQTLNQQKYTSNPGFLGFMNSTGLPFRAYDEFKRAAINERTDLYRAILEYEFGEYKG